MRFLFYGQRVYLGRCYKPYIQCKGIKDVPTWQFPILQLAQTSWEVSKYKWKYILIRSNKMQQYAGIYLPQNYSTWFGHPSHPSSGVHKTVTAASGTGHSIWVTTFLQCGLNRPSWRNVVTRILWPVSEAAITVLCTPDDGCDGRPKHVE